MHQPPFDYSPLRKQARKTLCFKGNSSAQCGQSIAEYAIIGALIIVVCIGALTLLGKNLTGVFGTLSSKASDPALISAKPQLPAAPPVSGPNVLNGSPLTMAASNSATSAALKSSTQQATTQTSGANGATESYTQNIVQAAQQALADGTIKQSDYDLIMQMANQGHKIATMEGLLQQSYETNNSTITFEGRSYQREALSSTLDNVMAKYGQLATQELNTLSRAKDQTLKQIIISNSANINSLVTNVYGATRNPQMQYDALTAAGGASNATNKSSATICTAGQHLDVNNHCVN